MISSVGSVEYEKEVEIKAEVSGMLKTVKGEVGDRIKAGDLVAKIETARHAWNWRNCKPTAV